MSGKNMYDDCAYSNENKNGQKTMLYAYKGL